MVKIFKQIYKLKDRLNMFKTFLFKTIELAYYITIILVIIFAFGISTQSMLYPNQQLNAELLKNVFFPAYFVIGGEYYTRSDIMNAGIIYE
jgi:glycopeptide antibiotics resistance protein